jgi:hypothetical protein
MDSDELLKWFLVILAADVVASLFVSIVVGVIMQAYSNWKKKTLKKIKCETCGKVKKTKWTDDGKARLCKECIKVYKREEQNPTS